MRIEFESRAEIQRLATILQEGIYPAPIIIDVEDLVDACGTQEDIPLPWNSDGFHVPLRIIKREDKTAGKVADKGGGKEVERLGRNIRCVGGECVPRQRRIDPTFVVKLSCAWGEID